MVSITVRLAPVRGRSPASNRADAGTSRRERPRRVCLLASAALVTVPPLLLTVETRPAAVVSPQEAPARFHREEVPME